MASNNNGHVFTTSTLFIIVIFLYLKSCCHSCDSGTCKAAKRLKSLSATPTRSSDNRVGLLIAWTPGDFTGPTNYSVVLERKRNLTGDVFVEVASTNISNYESQTCVYSDMLAYWEYRVTVTAYTAAGSGESFTVTNQTLMTVPGLPDFEFESESSVALDINTTITYPREQERNGTITGCKILKQLLNSTSNLVEKEELQEIYDLRSCEKPFSVKLHNLLVERNFSVQVKAINKEFEGNFSRDKSLFVQAKVPILDSKATVLKLIEVLNATETTVEAKLCKRCITDQQQGIIQELLLLVCTENSFCHSSEETKRSTDSITKYKTWSISKKYGFIFGYRTTPFQWFDQLIDYPGEYVTYTIGSNTSCKYDDPDYCNGPLPTDTKLKILVVVCNIAGCSEASSEYVTTTTHASGDDSSTKYIGLGVGVSLGALLIIIIGVVSAVKCRQRRRRQKASNRVKASENIYDLCERPYQDVQQYNAASGAPDSFNNVKQPNVPHVYEEVTKYSN